MPTAPAFHSFDHAHLAVMALTIAVPMACALAVRTMRSERLLTALCRLFAAMLVLSYLAHYIRLWHDDELTLIRPLPVQLCDWALFATVGALLTRRLRWFELAYFWGLGGTLQGILTPNLASGFPSAIFLIYFLIHCGIVAALLFLLLATPLRPQSASLLRVTAWSEFYLATALLVNGLTGANFGFLSHKPAGRTLLSALSDHAWLYVLEINLLAFALFAILYLPFFLRDLIARRRSQPAQNSPNEA